MKPPDVDVLICSVLAGCVWDQSNPYVTQPDRALPLLAHLVKTNNKAQSK